MNAGLAAGVPGCALPDLGSYSAVGGAWTHATYVRGDAYQADFFLTTRRRGQKQ